MRDFEGRWRVAAPLPPAAAADDDDSPSASGDGDGGSPAAAAARAAPNGAPRAARARVEHVLAVKPLMPIPGPVAHYTKGIFTRQVAAILRDLEREVAARASSLAAAGGAGAVDGGGEAAAAAAAAAERN